MIEGSGQIVHDFSGHGNNGILGTSTAVEPSDPTWIRGGLFGALHFSGSQTVTIPDSASLAPSQVTVIALVRGAASPGWWRYRRLQGGDGLHRRLLRPLHRIRGDRVLRLRRNELLRLASGAGEHLERPLARRRRNLRRYDRARLRGWLRDRSGTTVPTAFTIAYGLPIGAGAVGSYGGCDLAFSGDVDEVSIWSAALPIGQIFPRAQALLASALR